MSTVLRLLGRPKTSAIACARNSLERLAARWVPQSASRNIANYPISYENRLHVNISPTESLQRLGHCLIPNAFSQSEVNRLMDSVNDVFHKHAPDARDGRKSPENAAMFRYEMINRSEQVRQVMSDRRILDIIDPLLGENCHMISSTAWRNPADVKHAPRGQKWHVDAGPFIPRPAGIPWNDKIPYPVFIIAVHVFLEDVSLEDGPTAVLEGSHRSGREPPKRRKWDIGPQIEGYHCVPMIAKAGDIGMFVSDVWHRRLPPQQNGRGRHFLQTNYGRRDIAQRIKPSSEVRHVQPDIIGMASSHRERTVLGDHPQGSYDG